MCIPGLDPLTIASLVATAAGTGASMYGAKQNADMQNAAIAETNRQNQRAAEMANAARAEEAARQFDMERLQAEEVTKALMDADPMAALHRAQAVADDAENPITMDPGSYNREPPQMISDEVVQHAAGEVSEREERTDTMLDALALLSALGADFAGTGDMLGQTGSRISTLGGHRRGSLNASNLETSIPAATVYPGDSPIGDMLILGGQAVSNIGGRGIGKKGDIGDILLGGKRPKMPNPSLGSIASGGLY